MPSFTINEPHPTVAKNAYTYSGRGGAGNIFRAPETTKAAGVPTKALPVKETRGYYTGIGGAGNFRKAGTRPVMSLDEEYERAVAAESHPVSFTGRGGAGNAIRSASSKAGSVKAERKSSVDHRDSVESTHSARPTFWGRISGASVGSN